MVQDLWPHFDFIPTKPSPKTIIEQAGVGLENKTKGLVRFWLLSKDILEGIVSLTFSIHSRSLGYHFPFLKVRFPIVDGYPVELVADKIPDTLRATSEEELIRMLTRVFQSPSTIDTIQKLVALSE